MCFHWYPFKKNCCCKSSNALSLTAFTPPLPCLSSTRPFNPISSASDSYLYVHELELNSKRSSLGADWTEPSHSQACTRSQTSAAATKQWWSVQQIANKAATETQTNMRCQWQSPSHLTLMWISNRCTVFILCDGILRKYCFISLLLTVLKLSQKYLTNSNWDTLISCLLSVQVHLRSVSVAFHCVGLK